MSGIVRIFLDTETTGLSTVKGDHHGAHRIVEIGCIKTVDGVVVEKFHTYINPEREVPEGAAQIHGLQWSFLRQYPTFSKIYQNFLDFLGDCVLVIHNARFDTTFLNWELAQLSLPELNNPVEDTLVLARKKFPGSPASLDALCRRFRISLAERTYHGALLDAELLRSVYQAMCTEQNAFDFRDPLAAWGEDPTLMQFHTRQRLERTFTISSEEAVLHAEALLRVKKKD